MIVRSRSSFDFSYARQTCGTSWGGCGGVVTGGEGVGGIRHLCALKSAPKSASILREYNKLSQITYF